jgi:predicted HicB family RNase H-like nuclease
MTDILQYEGYFASVHFGAEDEVFFGKIIGINDSVTFEGGMVKELKKAFHEAVDDYLETCKQLGKEPEKMYKGSFNVRFPSELHRQATLYSAAKNMSLNEFVRLAIDFTLARASGPGGAVQPKTNNLIDMGNVSTNKKLTTDVVVDKSIQDHGNDPGVQERVKKAVAFLKKHGVPKSFEKKK